MDPSYQNPYTGYYGTKPHKPHRGCSVPLFFLAIFSLCILGLFYVRWLDDRKDAVPADNAAVPQVTSFNSAELIIESEADSAPLHNEFSQVIAIGFRGATVPDSVQRYYRFPAGVYVSYAEVDGLLEGDVITAVNGTVIASLEELNAIKNRFTAGDPLVLSIWHDGETREITVTLVDRDDMD